MGQVCSHPTVPSADDVTEKDEIHASDDVPVLGNVANETNRFVEAARTAVTPEKTGSGTPIPEKIEAIEQPPSSPIADALKSVVQTVGGAIASGVEVVKAPFEKESFQERRYREIVEAGGGQKNNDEPAAVERRPSSVGVSLEYYVNSHDAKFENLLNFESPEGWESLGEFDGVNKYTKFGEGESLIFFKGVCDIHHPIHVILDVLKRCETRKEWDEMCLGAKTIDSNMPFYRAGYFQIRSPIRGIVSDRDLCTMTRAKFMEDGSVLVAVQQGDYPLDPNFVRLEFVQGGYIFRKISDNCYRTTWTGQVDPKGWLPTWLANRTAHKQAMTVGKLNQYLCNIQAKD